MHTNYNGTNYNNVYPGLWNYGASTTGVTPTGGDNISYPPYFKCKDIINSGVPYIILLNSYDGRDTGHAVSCFGYYETNGSNYLIINNSWNKNWTFENFKRLDIDRLTYSRWN